MRSSLPLTALVASASANVGIMLPIYEYPTAAAMPDWKALMQAVDAHPQLDFYVIINNGQGAPYDTSPPGSIQDWAKLLGQLHNRTNVHTLGYVFTSHSTRANATVKNGVDQYASWTAHKGWDGDNVLYDIHMDGIFFDEIVTDPSLLAYNKEIASYAGTVFGSRSGPVALNPGGLVQQGSESLFDVADVIVNIETCYTTVQGARDTPTSGYRCPTGRYTPFTPAMLDSLPQNRTRVARSSVLVHDAYDSWNSYQPATLSTLRTDVKAMVNKGVHSFCISQLGYNANFTAEPASITTVSRLAAAAQGLS
ncbi:Spherulation-specific family 4-domain-containing protein [Diplogelasinospora grovesii]|uniref:Spherulation-specific family 4-domain-containing protein n=1 Tax=Diplogelasinospora grovesii TaxID=303347 RepID=A0AAN6N703_9PEZI|nr:Spherulation-specific family 4-domain-containing protein [Diplogelasinospora grovesii]